MIVVHVAAVCSESIIARPIDWRHRRATGVIALVLLGGAAVATAADLISIGEPVEDPRGKSSYTVPGDARVQLAVTAASGGALPFGVGIYTAGNGDRCAIAGQVRGTTLGAVERGVFRPFAAGRTGSCDATRSFFDTGTIAGRTVVFGRAAAAVRLVRVTVEGKPASARPGRGGAFLFVYDSGTPREGIDVRFE